MQDPTEKHFGDVGILDKYKYNNNITPSILNKNGGDRLRKMSISSIFEEEILENCRFWEVQTSGFGLCIIYPNYLSCFKVVPEPGQRN